MPSSPKLAFAIVTLIALLFAGDVSASDRGRVFDATFFVATDGDDGRQNSTEDAPFRTIDRAVKEAVKFQKINRGSEIKIWVKAGEYRDESLDLRYGKNDNHPLNNTVFEGYRDSLGDIAFNEYKFSQEDALDPAKMPLLQGNGRTKMAFNLSTGNINNTLRNFQIQGYTQRGVELSGADRNKLENIIVYSVTATPEQIESGRRFGGIGINCTAKDCRVRNCVVGNVWGAGVSVSGDNNVFEDCHCFCDAKATDNGTDYYYPVVGSGNKFLRCSQFRHPMHPHLGHGFIVRGSSDKDSASNTFTDCVSINVLEAFHVMGQPARNPEFELNKARDNVFDHCKAINGSIYLGWASSENTFVDCQISGNKQKFLGAGIRVANWSGGGRTSSSNNTFSRCQFRNVENFIDFSMFWDRTSNLSDGPASGNTFYDCSFENGYTLFRTQRPNKDTAFEGCKFSQIMHFHNDEGPPLDASFRNSMFYENGFDPPTGPGNLGYERGASFPPTDIDSGLVGHWKFDEANGQTVVRDSASGFHGALIGGGIFQPGKLGGCLFLEPEQRVDVGDVLDLADQPAITISAWINAASWGSRRFIIDKHGSDGNFRLGTTRNARQDVQGQYDNHLVAYVRDGAVEKSTSQLTNDFTRMVPGRWYHVAAVIDSEKQTWQLFVDGILRNEIGLTKVRADTAASLLFGNGFHGYLDDVRIYDRALDVFDMKSLVEFTASPDNNSNLMKNGDFEDGRTGWVKGNGTKLARSKVTGSMGMSLGARGQALIAKKGMSEVEAGPSSRMKLLVSAFGNNAELSLGFYYWNARENKLGYFDAKLEEQAWAPVGSAPRVYAARFVTPADCRGTIRPVFLHRIADASQVAGRLIIDDIVIKRDNNQSNLLRNGDFEDAGGQNWQSRFDWIEFEAGTAFTENGGTLGSRGITGSPLRLESSFKTETVVDAKILFSAMVKGEGELDFGFLVNQGDYRAVGKQAVSSKQFRRVFFEYAIPENVSEVRPLLRSLSGSVVVDDLDMRYDFRNR